MLALLTYAPLAVGPVHGTVGEPILLGRHMLSNGYLVALDDGRLVRAPRPLVGSCAEGEKIELLEYRSVLVDSFSMRCPEPAAR